MSRVDSGERAEIFYQDQIKKISFQNNQCCEKSRADYFFVIRKPREKFFRVNRQNSAEQKYERVMQDQIIHSPHQK